MTGRLGLLLAISPGFATAVFPPSGIALAVLLLRGCRLWPGIFLGSFAFNLHQALASTEGVSALGAVPVCASIAVGSTLQTLAGVWAVRRFTSTPTELVRERDIPLFLLLAGPVASLIAPTWGVTTLGVAGLAGSDALGYTWFTWWVGDTIGVLIFAPLVMTLLAEPRSIWRPRLRSVGLPLCVAFASVVTVFGIVSEREQESIAWNFRRDVESLDRSLRRDIVAHSEVLWSIRSFFAGSQNVDSEEFATFVRRPLEAFPALRALSFNQFIGRGDRAAFESDLEREAGVRAVFRERDEMGAPIPARPGDEHVAVRFIAPLAGNEIARGYDVLGDATRRTAFELARDSGAPAATGRINLIQGLESRRGFLLVLPIYETDRTPPTVALRRESLRGFAVAVLDAEQLLKHALASSPTPIAEVSLWDEAAPPATRLLARFPERAEAGENPRAAALAVTMLHDVGARPWSLRFVPTRTYLASHDSWRAWVVLSAGLTFTGILGALLLVVTGRAELEAWRRREVAELNRRLELTNEELARFAGAASHDLRGPLRNIDCLAGFILEDHGDELPAEARTHLAGIRQRAGHLSRLLEGMLEYSRAGWLEQEPELVSTADVVREVWALSNGTERFTLEATNLPTIETYRVPFEQVLRNLLGNATKYHDGPRGFIEVRYRDLGDRHEFAVRDDGPGIHPEHHGRVFQMFQRLHTDDQVDGSGMGLALVRKIVTNHGGEVSIDSDGVRGTTVRFTWPATAASTARAA